MEKTPTLIDSVINGDKDSFEKIIKDLLLEQYKNSIDKVSNLKSIKPE